MTIYEYLGISESDYKFKRDYIQNPLKKVICRVNGGLEYEQPDLDDVKYLYLTLNKSAKEMNKIMGYKIQDKLKVWCNKREYMRTPKLSKEELYNKLYVENIPMIQIAKFFGYQSTAPIQYWCNIYNIEIKSPRYVKNKITRDKLYELYIVQNKKLKEVVSIFNSTKKTILGLLQKYEIKKSKELKSKQRFEVNFSQYQQDILKDGESLEKYISENKITHVFDLSMKLGISQSTLNKYINKYRLRHLFTYVKSSYEIELNDIYTNLFESNNKKILSPYEIDLYNDDKHIGIEFNGNYWHGEKIKNKRYHQQKSLLAEDKDIFIYHIFEYEWNTKKKQILNQLNNLLGINEHKIYARKCIIKEVDNTEKRQFLWINHLQGDDSSSIRLGLYYENELVSLMTFVKPRFNKKYQWELSRFCSKANCNVIGGASKLFKYFINNYKPVSIISYSNIAHTRGNLYKTLGMTLQGISEPNYVWSDGHTTLSRYQCQKHKLIEQGFEGKSEVDIMSNRGYYRIYDCGNKVWVWNNI